jgi:hypothetical protein
MLGLNPSIVLYEAQFYSTAIVAYSLVVIFYLLMFSKLKNREILIIMFLLSNLVFMRSSYLLYLVIPIYFVLFKKIFPLESIVKVFTILISFAILAIPVWAQSSRIEKFDLPTMQASGATGVILGLSSFQNFKGFPYAPAGYYPFTELDEVNSKAQNLNPDINSTPRKVNGLPNWNYDGYLKQFKLDSSNFPQTLLENRSLLVPFIGKSLVWGLTNPACSRVILPENYSALSFLDGFPRNLIMIRSPWKFENSQLTACQGSSSLDFSYLLILVLYGFSSFGLFLKIFRKNTFTLDNRDSLLNLFNLFVFFSILVSTINGSPETSKYRLESEGYLLIFAIYYFFRTRQQRLVKL